MLLRCRSRPLLLNSIQIGLTWRLLLATSSTWHCLGLISLVWGSDARLGRLALWWLRGPHCFVVMTMIHSSRLSNMRMWLSRLPLLLLVDHLVVTGTVPSAAKLLLVLLLLLLAGVYQIIVRLLLDTVGTGPLRLVRCHAGREHAVV